MVFLLLGLWAAKNKSTDFSGCYWDSANNFQNAVFKRRLPSVRNNLLAFHDFKQKKTVRSEASYRGENNWGARDKVCPLKETVISRLQAAESAWNVKNGSLYFLENILQINSGGMVFKSGVVWLFQEQKFYGKRRKIISDGSSR